MYRAALTGSIASGKSAVAEEWARLGAPIIDADELARAAVEPGTPGLQRVRDEFGDAVIGADGTLDRSALRDIVFADGERRKALERILHPEIARLRDEKEAALAAAGNRVVAHVIPLLFETGMQDAFDAIVLVESAAPVRLDRLIRLRGLEPAQAEAMVAAQLPATRKRQLLDEAGAIGLRIENNGTLDELKEQARDAWRTIERAAKRTG